MEKIQRVTDIPRELISSFLFVNDGVDHGYSCDIDNVADRAFEPRWKPPVPENRGK